jgi:hypothetical protein
MMFATATVPLLAKLTLATLGDMTKTEKIPFCHVSQGPQAK